MWPGLTSPGKLSNAERDKVNKTDQAATPMAFGSVVNFPSSCRVPTKQPPRHPVLPWAAPGVFCRARSERQVCVLSRCPFQRRARAPYMNLAGLLLLSIGARANREGVWRGCSACPQGTGSEAARRVLPCWFGLGRAIQRKFEV